MAGYAKLSKMKECLLVGKTKALLELGYTPNEIAKRLKQPIVRINHWIELIKQAEEETNK